MTLHDIIRIVLPDLQRLPAATSATPPMEALTNAELRTVVGGPEIWNQGFG
jgi:hypothetical protein